MRTISELLKGHVSLQVECVDRIYLNGYVPTLQQSGGLIHFLEKHRGEKIGSPALLGQITNNFVARIGGICCQKPDSARAL